MSLVKIIVTEVAIALGKAALEKIEENMKPDEKEVKTNESERNSKDRL